VTTTDPHPSVVAVVGSPRGDGNSVALVDAALGELTARGACCSRILLGEQRIAPCLGHDSCADHEACPLGDDAAAVLERVYSAAGLILATPVYYENVSAQMKALMDRSVFRFSHGLWLRAEVVGLMAVTAETGLDDALDAMARYVALSSDREIPTLRFGAVADVAGRAAADEGLLAGARRLAGEMAARLGLTPV
jgi:multimeric flavodoxin WrbA